MIIEILSPGIKPDWKNPKDYEFLNNLTLDQWAFEFLKRNPKYLKEWEQLTANLTLEEKIEIPDYLMAIKKVNPKKINLRIFTAHEWGINGPYLNPEPYVRYKDIPFIPFGGKEDLDIIPSFKGIMVTGLPDFDKGTISMEFNFNQPIIPQIKNAEKELTKLQKISKEKGNSIRKAFRPRRDEWILLLRILDAQGVKNKDIAKTLYPHIYPHQKTITDDPQGIKFINDKKRQAKRYATKEYRHIPFYLE